MAVDIEVRNTIDRPAPAVAAYACNPENAPAWYANIKEMEWVEGPPAQLGAKMAFVARFLGKRLAYTYEIVELVEGERMVMQTAEGPFPMQTTYTFTPDGPQRCTMTLRNAGEPAGFSKLVAPLMARAMRKAMTADLALIKQILEDESGG